MQKLTQAQLIDKLSSMNEEEVIALLEIERTVHKRVYALARLHQRYCTLRNTRERLELLSSIK